MSRLPTSHLKQFQSRRVESIANRSISQTFADTSGVAGKPHVDATKTKQRPGRRLDRIRAVRRFAPGRRDPFPARGLSAADLLRRDLILQTGGDRKRAEVRTEALSRPSPSRDTPGATWNRSHRRRERRERRSRRPVDRHDHAKAL